MVGWVVDEGADDAFALGAGCADDGDDLGRHGGLGLFGIEVLFMRLVMIRWYE